MIVERRSAYGGPSDGSMRRRLFAGMKSLTGFGSRSRHGSPHNRSISLPESTNNRCCTAAHYTHPPLDANWQRAKFDPRVRVNVSFRRTTRYVRYVSVSFGRYSFGSSTYRIELSSLQRDYPRMPIRFDIRIFDCATFRNHCQLFSINWV